jgi:hypothetical protein
MLYSLTSVLKAQSNTDANFLFKVWLFTDRENSKESSKSDSFFAAFSAITELKLDKIDCNLFGIDYQFYFLKLYDIKNNKFIDNVSYSRAIASNETKDYIIPVNKYIGQYVITINPRTGMSYRIMGFNGNDFLGFLSDFKEEFKRKNKNRLSNKKFLKKYYVEGIDFNCLYKGLKAKEVDRHKYPCLIRCSDPVSIH